MRREIELRLDPAARDRVRPQADDRPVELQQGFFLPRRLLPVLRDGAWREAEGGTAPSRPTRCRPCRSRRSRRSSARRAILITGVGGTGVVTVGAVLGMAAHLDGLGVGIIDMAGLAQKGGAVTIHMRIAPTPEDIHAIRIAAEEADTVLACDIVVAGSQEGARRDPPGRSAGLRQSARDLSRRLHARRRFLAADAPAAARDRGARRRRAARISSRRSGSRPRSRRCHRRPTCSWSASPGSRAACRSRTRSILEAIRLNGVEVGDEPRRVRMGPPRGARSRRGGARGRASTRSRQRRRRSRRSWRGASTFLTDYQNAAYAARYSARVERIAAAERARRAGRDGARDRGRAFALQADGDQGRIRGRAALHRRLVRAAARRAVRRAGSRLEFHLAPPLLARPRQAHRASEEAEIRAVDDARLPRARAAPLAARHARSIRSAGRRERRWERQLLADYEAVLDTIEAKLSRRQSRGRDRARRLSAERSAASATSSRRRRARRWPSASGCLQAFRRAGSGAARRGGGVGSASA